MHAINVHQTGGPKQLRYETVTVPEPRAGEVRVKLDAIGVNFVEIYQRKGLYQGSMPFIPGTEAAGVVDMVAPGVTELKPGDRIVSTSFLGAYADYALVSASQAVTLPDAFDLHVAAAVALQGMTAHYLTHSTFPLQPGQVALVHAAAGGLGALVVQMAKERGARVIGTVSTEEKAQIAREAGADDVILYTQQDFEAETKRLTAGAGVDVVYDSVGKTTFDGSLNCLKRRGYMVLCGQSSGPVPPFNPQVLNAKGSLYLTRPTLAHYTATRDELAQRMIDIFRWIANRRLVVRIDKTYRLSDAAEAHRYLEARQTRGKVLLIP